MGPTLFGNSPYQSSSAFAGNPLFVDIGGGLKGVGESTSGVVNYVDYDYQYEKKKRELRSAFELGNVFEDPKFASFCDEQAWWLDDFATFSAVKTLEKGRAWYEWSDEGLRDHKSESIRRFDRENADEIAYHKYVQYLFFNQWLDLKDYANSNGISIIGDMPIYVSLDSADVWSNREDYLLDPNGRPTSLAGVPPDLFSSTGQLWGNPIYDWEHMQKNGFKWWQSRYIHASKLFDVVRIDHFIGIVNYYSVPAAESDAVRGEWKRGPSHLLIDALKDCGSARIIAEDLGIVTDEVRELMREAGYPGMRIMQFGLDGDPTNPHLPTNCPENCVFYGGTHDNETLRGFVSRMGVGERTRICELAGSRSVDERALTESLVRFALESRASLAVIQLQDYLMLGNEARINVPSTLGGRNWRWTLGNNADALFSIAPYIKKLTAESGR